MYNPAIAAPSAPHAESHSCVFSHTNHLTWKGPFPVLPILTSDSIFEISPLLTYHLLHTFPWIRAQGSLSLVPWSCISTKNFMFAMWLPALLHSGDWIAASALSIFTPSMEPVTCCQVDTLIPCLVRRLSPVPTDIFPLLMSTKTFPTLIQSAGLLGPEWVAMSPLKILTCDWWAGWEAKIKVSSLPCSGYKD